MTKKKNLVSAIIFLFMSLAAFPVKAQELGMSFSFFFPTNGYFSTPVSPFSIRGLGVHPTRFFSIESGFSLYRMAGLNVRDIPYETKEPVMGPLFSLFVPLEGILEAKTGNIVFRAKGGGFAFYNFASRINYGNLDRAISAFYDWEVANANFDYDNNIGTGWMAGGEVILYFTEQFGINLEINYLSGGSALNFRGTVTGGDTNGIDVLEVNLPEARLDFRGWEVTLGILFSNR